VHEQTLRGHPAAGPPTWLSEYDSCLGESRQRENNGIVGKWRGEKTKWKQSVERLGLHVSLESVVHLHAYLYLETRRSLRRATTSISTVDKGLDFLLFFSFVSPTLSCMPLQACDYSPHFIEACSRIFYLCVYKIFVFSMDDELNGMQYLFSYYM